jgi:hypothetical protein
MKLILAANVLASTNGPNVTLIKRMITISQSSVIIAATKAQQLRNARIPAMRITQAG